MFRNRLWLAEDISVARIPLVPRPTPACGRNRRTAGRRGRPKENEPRPPDSNSPSEAPSSNEWTCRGGLGIHGVKRRQRTRQNSPSFAFRLAFRTSKTLLCDRLAKAVMQIRFVVAPVALLLPPGESRLIIDEERVFHAYRQSDSADRRSGCIWRS